MTNEGLPVWNLTGLYAGSDDLAIEADLAEADRIVADLASAPDLLAAYELANALLARVAAFAALHEDGRLAPLLQPRVDAIVARAPALADIAPDLKTPPEVESRVVATMLSAIAEAGPRLWYRTNLQTEAELLPWTWAEAVEIAAEAAGGLSPDMGAAVRQVLAEGRVHASTSNAPMSHPAADRGPYVRLGFDGSLRSVLTLAHELGHAAHQLLSRPLGVLRCDPQPALAETVAATLEMAAARTLGGQGGGERRTLQVLAARDLYTAVVRHGALARMERRGELNDGGWKSALRALAGPEALKAERPDAWRAFGVLERAPGEAWTTPFARLAAALVIEERDRDPAAFAPRWTRLLSAGGTAGTTEALGDLGVDVAAPGVWSRALALAAR
jgi:oligoendopeptidase F